MCQAASLLDQHSAGLVGTNPHPGAMVADRLALDQFPVSEDRRSPRHNPSQTSSADPKVDSTATSVVIAELLQAAGSKQ